MPRAHAAKPGGTLRIARGQESDTLDPQKTTLLVAHEIMWQVYDSLVYLDEKGTVYPGLATSWEFSNEGKTVTLKLREGVNFHDGSPFNAEVRPLDRGTPPRRHHGLAHLVDAGPDRRHRGDRRHDHRLSLQRSLRAALGGARLFLLRAHQ